MAQSNVKSLIRKIEENESGNKSAVKNLVKKWEEGSSCEESSYEKIGKTKSEKTVMFQEPCTRSDEPIQLEESELESGQEPRIVDIVDKGQDEINENPTATNEEVENEEEEKIIIDDREDIQPETEETLQPEEEENIENLTHSEEEDETNEFED